MNDWGIFFFICVDLNERSINRPSDWTWNKFQREFLWWFMFGFWECTICSRFSSSAAISSPLHTTPSPGVCGHVAGRPEGQRAGLRHGRGVHQHRVRYRTWAFECRSESSAAPGTESTGTTSVFVWIHMRWFYEGTWWQQFLFSVWWIFTCHNKD